MGKAKGPKRKEAPARKRLQAGNSGLVDKQSHRRRNGGVYHSAGINGGSTLGKRSLSQQLLLPNKQGRRGKRRRKGDGPISKPRSSEAAAIQAEYDAVDAREKGKKDAEEARRRRAVGKIDLAPASAVLRLPSEGDPSMTSLRASSARMVEALLQSITDDPAPSAAPPSRPIRSAGRKRSGNPYASLGGDSDSDANEPKNGVGSASAGGNGRQQALAFAQPSGVFSGFIRSSVSGVASGGGRSGEVDACAGVGASPRGVVQAQVASGEDDGEDPDL